MAIDLAKENCLPLAKAAKTLPRVRGNKPPHPLTLYRWATVGLKSKNGHRVYLETEFVGGTRVTSVEALERFFAQKNDCRHDHPTQIRDRHSKELKREAEQAIARLREKGMFG